MADTKYHWFIARNANGAARLMHATEQPGGQLSLCGVFVGYWTRFHMRYVPGFACKKCAVRAGLIEQSRTIRHSNSHLRSVS